MMEFKNLDSLLHSQVRLAVMSMLMQHGEADFVFLRNLCGATSGNLSVQLNKLKIAGYIELKKIFKANYPQTICKLTAKGELAFLQYVQDLKEYIEV